MKGKGSRLALTLAAWAVAVSLLSGCAWSIGGKHGPCEHCPPQPTRGQELIDLKTARDHGAISEEEYQQQKKHIMER